MLIAWASNGSKQTLTRAILRRLVVGGKRRSVGSWSTTSLTSLKYDRVKIAFRDFYSFRYLRPSRARTDSIST